MPTSRPQYIIAIGASAGGMEEINLFFDNTPLDGVAYVIVQHLSPDFKSRMVELLARHSKLEVREANEGDEVRKNVVYLIPNDKFMTIKEGHLHLTEKEKLKGPHLTINTFFNSLADDCGDRAIGVVLSGLGADGTNGLKAIHEKGGMVMVRTPETSEFSSMPAHAIATGVADFILEPQLMPAAIASFVAERDSPKDESKDQEFIKEIISLIGQVSPMDFSGYKQTTILRRTKKRAEQENFASLEDYLLFLRESPEGLIVLAGDFLISVTAFFRDAGAFEIISEKVVPELLENLKPGEELKVWVAGCATGEEAYSIAITIAEKLIGNQQDTVVKIFATDIDGVAMTHAAKGLYSADRIAAVSEDRLERFFVKEGDSYRIKPLIRRMVIFAKHDLSKNPPYCNMHMVCCRNLLIYLMPVLQKKVFSMLLFGLKIQGYLFLGSSENPTPIIGSLEVINKRWKIYKNVKGKRALSYDAFSLPELPETRGTNAAAGVETSKLNGHQFGDFMSNAFAVETGFLCLFVDSNNQVIKSYGDTANFLLQENFNSNLDSLLQAPLSIALHALAAEVTRTGKKASVARIPLKELKETTYVDLTVVPVPITSGSEEILMLLLKTSEEAIASTKVPVFDGQTYLDQYTKGLEYEIKQLKNKLHELNEQLDASNENMQSFNEELVSANEEMQSTNEEMQSVNEELHTINSDYQLKNRELMELNDDLNNYFRSNVNGQLFINGEMLLMKFSPAAVKLMNLMDSDIGRPIHHISTNIKFQTILTDITQVMEHGVIVSKQIQTTDEKWYQMMIMPYLQHSSLQASGAIITFSDITGLKDIQLELDRKNQSLLRINEDLDNFIHTASHDLLAPLGNIETSISIMNSIALSDAKLLDVLNLINRSIKTYRQLITDISVIAKIESETGHTEMVNLAEIIENIEWSLQDKILLSKATIKCNLQVKEVRFSKKNLRSILFNLVANAIKFKADTAPVITISSMETEGKVVLRVRDNGKGMNKDELDRIFEMYGRLHQDVEGNGIGLYLAKKIINATGGRLTVESEVGEGTTFTIYLA